MTGNDQHSLQLDKIMKYYPSCCALKDFVDCVDAVSGSIYNHNLQDSSAFHTVALFWSDRLYRSS